MVMPSGPARSTAWRRETEGLRNGISTSRSRPSVAGRPARRTQGPPVARRLTARPRQKPRLDSGRPLASARELIGRREPHHLCERGPSFAAGEQRFEAAHGVRRRPAPRGSPFFPFQGRFHTVEIAEGAPGIGRSRVVAQLLEGEGGTPVISRFAQQRGGALEGAAFDLSHGRAIRSGQQRARGGQSQGAQLVGQRRGGVFRGRDFPEPAGHQPGGGVDVTQRHVAEAVLAAEGRENRGQGLPAPLTQQAPTKSHQVTAPQDRELGVQRSARRHRDNVNSERTSGAGRGPPSVRVR